MRRSGRRWCLWVVAAAFGCASLVGCATATTDDHQRTIEPVGVETPESAGGAKDDKFVLSRGTTSGGQVPDPAPLHTGNKWWRFRADFLKISEAEAKDRDAAISVRQAPANFWDAQTANETVEIWGHVCNQCHGGRRHLKDAIGMPPPPPGWGNGDGLFFGNRRDYWAVFAVVNLGGPPRNGIRSPMPPWTGKLAKEQMWALLYFLEYQSGGIEGRFPPSLFPRPFQESR
jgi:mono/diheme cytochrome c family protein